MLFNRAIVLATAASGVLAAAPNLNQVFAEQESALSVAATADSTTTSSTSHSFVPHSSKSSSSRSLRPLTFASSSSRRSHSPTGVPSSSAAATTSMRHRPAFGTHHGRGMERKLRKKSLAHELEKREQQPAAGARERELELMKRRAGEHGIKDVPDAARLRRRDADAEEEGDIAVRDYQYTLIEPAATATQAQAFNFAEMLVMPASSSVSVSASTTSVAAAVATSAVSNALQAGYWHGASSYYLFALADTERYAVLDALADSGFKVIRIFVASVMQNNKGSNNAAVNDLEPEEVGTYDDSILYLIDQLMYDCSVRGLKLLIAMGDRYALGFWSTDAYATQLSIVKSGSTGAQKVADASAFYTNSWAISAYDNRLSHMMNHTNKLLGGKTWAQLDDVIYAVEPQNEPMGWMDLVAPQWVCNRAAHLQSLIPSGSSILVSSGGGVTTTASLGSWATSCDSLDIVSVHDYGTSASVTVSALAAAQASVGKSKLVMMGEWGALGSNKAQTIASFVKAFKAAGIPQMIWEVVKPGKASSDYEIWTDEPSWAALTGGAVASSAAPSSPAYKPTSSTQWSKSTASWSTHASSSSTKSSSASHASTTSTKHN